MANFTPTQLSICRMRYEQGKSKAYICLRNGLSGKELTNQIQAILRKVGVTSEVAVGVHLARAGIL